MEKKKSEGKNADKSFDTDWNNKAATYSYLIFDLMATA